MTTLTDDPQQEGKPDVKRDDYGWPVDHSELVRECWDMSRESLARAWDNPVDSIYDEGTPTPDPTPEAS